MTVKTHIKKGDTVKVLSGNSKGQTGKVLTIDRKKRTAVVEGVNNVSKHTKPDAKNQKGGIIKKEAAMHLSKLMLIDADGKPTRIGRRLDETTNKLVRYSKNTEEVIK